MIKSTTLISNLKDLIIQANTVLRPDVLAALKTAFQSENSANGKKALGMLLENVQIAKTENLPICQDTGYVDIFIQWPASLSVAEAFRPPHGNLKVSSTIFQDIANEAVRQAYGEQLYRASMVDDPLFKRKNTHDNTPANVTLSLSDSSELKLSVFIKGAGSDNASKQAMLNPSSSLDDIIEFVVSHVKEYGARSCPPLIIGIGIGATFDKVASLAKKALLRPIDSHDSRLTTHDYIDLEQEILRRVNELGIGPSALGGAATALAVNIEQAPCHMATLPIAINLNCYALRSASATLGG